MQPPNRFNGNRQVNEMTAIDNSWVGTTGASSGFGEVGGWAMQRCNNGRFWT
jgi:hypothetical protein